MLRHRYLLQPGTTQHDRAIGEVLAGQAVTDVSVAVAYVTRLGAQDLIDRISAARPGDWKQARKRWLISIDWLRTQPLGVRLLLGLPKSAVRVVDGATVVATRGCLPRVSFHPKVFALHAKGGRAVVHGSANLSRNGLTRSHEVGSVLEVAKPLKDGAELAAWKQTGAVLKWFDGLWRVATPYPTIRSAYERAYASRTRDAGGFTPTDDDAAPTTAVRNGRIDPMRIRLLESCDHFWIFSGQLHANRGPGVPGNQLMMSAMTRVFFGVEARDVPRDTHLGYFSVTRGAAEKPDCPLRFSNNSMDVLSLPVPGGLWPAYYDQSTLLFTRVVSGNTTKFQLEVGTAAGAARWKAASRRIGGAFAMTSGREWGAF